MSKNEKKANGKSSCNQKDGQACNSTDKKYNSYDSSSNCNEKNCD